MNRSHALIDRIRGEMAAQGIVSFARFMELALYEPGLGYYEAERVPIGRKGDFYTSVSVGPLFGELLAFQFAEWMDACPDAASPQWVEAGAHDGQLAADILSWARRQRPALADRLQYWIVEPSALRRGWQRQTLADFAAQVSWAETVSRVPEAGCRVLFCNELLDAFPIHRLGWNALERRWQEWGVLWDGNRFQWAKMPAVICPEAAEALQVPCELLASLPDGYIFELCPAAETWWREAAASLRQGWLVAIDYGFIEDELWAPERLHGTLRAYKKHRFGDDPLSDPGDQDLTAHVNFTVLRRAGEKAGLKTEAVLSQSQFLANLAARRWGHARQGEGWTPENARALQTLIHPAHLGRAFRVLIQSRRS